MEDELSPLVTATTSPVDNLETLKRSELKVTRPTARYKCSEPGLSSTVNIRDIIVAMNLCKTTSLLTTGTVQ